MTDPRRWNDDRVDDLAKLVEHNDRRLDAVQNLLAAHDLQLIEEKRAKAASTYRRFEVRLAMATLILGQAVTIAVLVIRG